MSLLSHDIDTGHKDCTVYFHNIYPVSKMASRAACHSVPTGESLSGGMWLFKSGRGLINSKELLLCLVWQVTGKKDGFLQ